MKYLQPILAVLLIVVGVVVDLLPSPVPMMGVSIVVSGILVVSGGFLLAHWVVHGEES